MKTQFLIKFIEDYKNCATITFIDESIYPNPITSPVLTISIPTFEKRISIAYVPKAVNRIDLNSIHMADLHSCLPNMLDGLWELELSICPNDKVKKSFFYYNVCSLMTQLKDNLCADSSKENIEKLTALRDKILVIQDLGLCNKEKADVMYNEIHNLLKTCKTC